MRKIINFIFSPLTIIVAIIAYRKITDTRVEVVYTKVGNMTYAEPINMTEIARRASYEWNKIPRWLRPLLIRFHIC